MWYEFCHSVSIPGLNKIADSNKFIIRRILWVIFVFGGIGFLVYHLHDRVKYFFGHPVMVSINVDYQKRLSFPALTLCNENAVRQLPNATDEDQKVLEFLSVRRRIRNDTNMEKFNWTRFIHIYAHQIEEMLMWCQWEKRACQTKNFTKVHTDWTLCYGFNYLGAQERLHTIRPGINNGLTMILNTQSDQYLIQTYMTGFKVAIHDPENIPQITMSSFTLAPGMVTNIALKRIQTKNLPLPYGKCGTKQLRYYDKYTASRCHTECHTNYTIRECQCRYPFMPSNVKVCEPDMNYLRCLSDFFIRDYADEIKKCNCPVDCIQEKYEITISLGKLNSAFYLSALDNGDGHGHDWEYWRKNLAVVNIYYEDLTLTTVEQQQAYPWLALLSDIGGALGLILGGCILTLVEAADFWIAIAAQGIGKWGMKRAKRVTIRRPSQNVSNSILQWSSEHCPFGDHILYRMDGTGQIRQHLNGQLHASLHSGNREANCTGILKNIHRHPITNNYQYDNNVQLHTWQEIDNTAAFGGRTSPRDCIQGILNIRCPEEAVNDKTYTAYEYHTNP